MFSGLLAALLIASVTTIAAESVGQSITIEDALAQALTENPAFAAAQWNTGIAEGARTQAGLIPNPELSWSVEDTRSESRITSIQVSQSIELGGKRGARIDVSERDQDAVAIDLERKKNILRAEVIQAFYSALRAQEGLQLSTQSQDLASRGLQVVEGRVKAGKASPIEISRAQVQLSEIQLELNRARLNRSNAYKQLALITGATTPNFEHVEGDLERLPYLPSQAEMLARITDTADVRLASMQIRRAESSLELEKSQRIPDINVSVGSQYDEGLGERVNLLGLSMPIPLFNRNQGNVLAAARGADQASDLRNATELRLRAEAQQAFEQWESARSEVDSISSTLLPTAQQAVEGAVRGFEMGKFAFIDVLDAQRTLVSMRSQYLNTLDEAISAWVSLEKIYGSQLNVEFKK
ncbi:TolC family protein [Pseudomonas sp. LS1212]|uniref:TolC family protein n=1 Tax=Pseudomonas sp. LS1212 TaxID=2972478 RepID=UPI00215C860F|nr:TolC family protein [Pseudomonas sp. LS1212]UVJ41946.1 TolC family protein [Pseudomonas sp. LS1212]